MRDLIIETIRGAGIWGVGLVMLLENVFPPIPSEIVMPLGGYLAATGHLPFWGVVAAGSAGSLHGAFFWYVMARRLGKDRLKAWAARRGAWVAMTPDDIERATHWFQRHGGRSVLLGRLLPFLRTVISVPAGISGMRIVPFTLFSAVGTFLWTLALAWAGRQLGRSFPRIESVLGWVTWAVLAGAAGWYIYGVLRVRRRRGARAGD